jgi:hypothetical protein
VPSLINPRSSLRVRVFAVLQVFLLLASLAIPASVLGEDPAPSPAPTETPAPTADPTPEPTVPTRACAATGTENVSSDKAHYRYGSAVQVQWIGLGASCQVTVTVTAPGGSAESSSLTSDSSGDLNFDFSIGSGDFLVEASGEDGIGLGALIVTGGPFVGTDKGDYLPGQTVRIQGAGLASGADLNLRVERPDGVIDAFSVSASSAGQFTFDYELTEGRGLVGDYTVQVLNAGGQVLADAGFTDASIFVQTIGTVIKTQVGNSFMSVTVPAGGVPAGHTVIASAAVGTFAGARSCSDSQGNTYTVDVVSASNDLFVCSGQITTALLAGDTITMSYPGFGGTSTGSANEFAGLLSPKTTDGSSVDGFSGSAISSGNITTTQANDLLFGTVRQANTSTAPTFTPTAATPPWNIVGTVGVGTTTSPKQWPAYRVVFSTGTYSYAGTLSSSGFSRIAIVAYKLETTPPSSSITFPVDSATYNSGTWTGSIDGTASDGSGSGVAEVRVSVKRLSDNLYWDGTSFASGSEVFNLATGTTSWSYAFPDGNLTTGVSYTVRSQAKDDAGNTETPGSGVTFSYGVPDTTGPGVTLSGGGSGTTNTATYNVTATFDEPAYGFTSGDVTVGNGSVSNFTGSDGDTVFTFDVTASADGAVTVDVAASVATDLAGNDNSASNQLTWTYDGTGPTVTINQAGTQADPTSTSPIHFTAVFNEPVSGFGNTDLSFTGSTAGGTLSAVVTQIAPNDGTTYDVAVSGMTSSGTVVASIGAGAASDAASNPNTASTSTDNTVTFNAPGGGYVLTAFFSPIDNLPTVNVAKAGQGIPVKWRLTDSSGNPVSDPSSFYGLVSVSASCSSWTGATDVAEAYVTGSSSLQYLGDGYWQYNWKTVNSWANTCRELTLTVRDGLGGFLTRSAHFQFKK